GCRQGAVQRDLELDAGGVVVARARAAVEVGGLVVQRVVAERVRIRRQAVALLGRFQLAGEADRAGPAFEQIAADDEVGRGQPRFGAVLAAGADRGVILRRDRVPETVLVEPVAVRAEEEAVGLRAQDRREFLVDAVLGAADAEVPVEARAELAAQADRDVPRQFVGMGVAALRAADFLRGEALDQVEIGVEADIVVSAVG
ncbi:Tat pathway signal sequence domain protein, partial [Clostridium sp. M62/1]